MTKLSDTQAVLLSSAAQRPDGSLLPLPTSLKPGGGATKALDALVIRGFAEERETYDRTKARSGDDERQVGLFLTAAGAAAIGVTLPNAEQQDVGGEDVPASLPVGKAPPKSAMVLDLLRRPAGATMAELIELTDWLPHTTRAALTGLRKKGHEITRGQRDGMTCYTVAPQ